MTAGDRKDLGDVIVSDELPFPCVDLRRPNASGYGYSLLYLNQGVRQARVSDMHLSGVVLGTVSGSFSQSVPEAFLKRIPEAFLKWT